MIYPMRRRMQSQIYPKKISMLTPTATLPSKTIRITQSNAKKDKMIQQKLFDFLVNLPNEFDLETYGAENYPSASENEIPTSASLIAGLSFVPSPTMQTVSPYSLIVFTILAFYSGDVLAKTYPAIISILSIFTPLDPQLLRKLCAFPVMHMFFENSEHNYVN